MRVFGSVVRHWRPCGRQRHGGQRLPFRGTRYLWIAHAGVYVHAIWRGGRGYRLLGLRKMLPPHYPYLEQWGTGWDQMPIKKRFRSEGPVLQVALDATTAILKKCPLLMEFLTATAYEDGTPRQPGYYTVRNRVIEFEITLYDPDAGMRVSVRSREHDKMFWGAEAILGAEDVAWEVDRYLTERLPKKKEKKK